jgi:hypothetical protein
VSSSRRVAVLCAVVGAAALMRAVPADAQLRAGPEFQIAGPLASRPAVARAPFGFVAVWTSGTADSRQILGRRFDLAGVPLGPEFVVGAPHPYGSYYPRVATAANGDFMVVWLRFRLDPDAILARCFDALGRPFGPEFQVDPGGVGYVRAPEVAARPDGTYFVAWSSANADGSNFGVLGRVFDRACQPLANQFVVNAHTTGTQTSADVTAADDGTFMVAWSSFKPSGPAIAGRRFDAAGAPVGGERDLGVGSAPVIAAGRGREFAVAWNGGTSPIPDRLVARWFGETAPRGPERRLSFGFVPQKDIATDGFGRAWVVFAGDLSGGIFLTEVPAFFDPPAPLLRVNADAGDTGTAPVIASDDQGNLLVAWSGVHAQASGVFAQRFGGVHPTGIAVDAAPAPSSDGNGMLEPGETVELQTTWRNLNGSMLDLAGTLSFRLAPFTEGAAIADGAGAYGAVPDGAARGLMV